jgi:arylsulfatase A-like enzyme
MFMKKHRAFGLTVFTPVFFILTILYLLSTSYKTTHINAKALETAFPSPHIILIIVDTLRIDHVSAYGYERPTTPILDAQIADKGVRFVAHTSSPWTCPSNAAIVTGRQPSVIGATWETIENSVPESESTIAEYLNEAGYYTAGFTSGPYCVRGSLGFDQGFDIYADAAGLNGPIRAEVLNTQVFDWLNTTWASTISGTQPLFLYMYYFDPHTWYDPPAPYDTLYYPGYTGSLTPAKFAHGETAKSGELVLSEDDLNYLNALYDGEITYWDFHLGQLLEKLEDQTLLDNTLIVITTDHGEMLGEHDEWSHAGSLYEEVVRVPLLMRYTGVISSGLKITTPVQSMDLMPTILDYADVQVPENIQAVSLRPYIERSIPFTMTRPIYSEVDKVDDPSSGLAWASPPDDLRSVSEGGWKYIHHLNQGDSSELFMLQPASIYETDNVILQFPQKHQQLRNSLYDWFYPYQAFLPVSIK